MDLKKDIKRNIDKLTSDLSINELVPMIKKLTKEYYINYFNGNNEATITIFNILNKLASNNDSYNIKCFINYCLLSSINDLITEKSDVNLLSFEVALNESESEVVVNLLEKVKVKRQELRELIESEN